MRLAVLIVAGGLALAGCGDGVDADGHGGGRSDAADSVATVDGPTSTETEDITTADCDDTTDADHPDVVGATVEDTGDGTFTVAATLCSAYDTPDRYADAFRVLDADTGEVLGVRELTHPHADEQPFTRSLTGVAIPDAVTAVVVEGHDLANGWGGATVRVELSSG